MAPHIKMFLDFWGFTIADLPEICCWKCDSNQHVQIMHIDQKGMGGRDSALYPENLMPGCAKCHRIAEGNTLMKGLLWGILVKRILARFPNHQCSDFFKKTWYYKSELK